jgi:hypothetical protein
MTESEKVQTVRKTPVRRKKAGPKTLSALSRSADREAKRLGVAILEVLGGMRTPSEAAEALGVSLPRYYALESRALGGFLAACKKPPRGPHYSPEREIEKLERDIERLESECARSHALLRVAQRSVGLAAPDRTKKQKTGGKKGRKRKPTARALRLVTVLKDNEKTMDARGVPAENVKEVQQAKS